MVKCNIRKIGKEEGIKEVDSITWEKVGLRMRRLYDQTIEKFNRR